MDILLHICCGPCLIYPYQRLKAQGFGIQGFYYNPNIYPEAEFFRRAEGVKILSREYALEVSYPGYNPDDYLVATNAVELSSSRCQNCWSMRLLKTARQAKFDGFKAFSSTLLVSPYQDHQQLKQLGERIGQEVGIDFYYEDFRLGFKLAQTQAKEKGLYRQKYCGCKYSIIPRAKSILSAPGCKGKDEI